MITKMDAFTDIRAIVADQPETERRAELLDWIDGQMYVVSNALNKDKEKRLAVKAAAGPDELQEIVYQLLTNVPQSIPEILKQIDGDDMSAPLITTRLTALVKAGKAKKEKVMVPKTETSAARSYMVYTRA